MELTQQEIQFIKDMYKESVANMAQIAIDNQVQEAMKIIADKYAPLLEQAASEENFELRRQLIEQQTEEAKAKEIEIRGI